MDEQKNRCVIARTFGEEVLIVFGQKEEENGSKESAMAGTLESSDAQVTVEPGNGSVELSIESSVIHQFGKQIKATVLETLNRLDVKDAKVTVVDKGALDCTLKARVECAVYRSNDITENLPWGGVIK